ncbi:MAG TPA: hypothetical protein VLT86_13150 [Vicinamibacterales bacterium]|nr:hypothetical protein [Vicinamibacterales bacterium]
MRTVLTALAALIFAVADRPAAQSRPVSVQVVVTDADGRAVGGLTEGDFQIASGGRPRAVESFSAGPSPLTICLLLDVSASMDGTLGPGRAPAGLAAAMEAWLDARQGTADRWLVGTISRHVAVGATPVADGPDLRAAIQTALGLADTQRFGPSPIWDTVDAALGALEGESGRRGVILVTDGRSTGDRLGVRDAIRRGLGAGVPVTVISEAPDQTLALSPTSLLLVRPELALQLIVEQTGGSYLPAFTDPKPALGSLLDRAIDELRQAYVLTFSGTAADGEAHTLEVSVRHPGARVKTRKAVILGTGR